MKKLITGKRLLLLGLAVIVAAAGGFGVKHFNTDTPIAQIQPVASPVNYDPPTQQDKDQTQAHKEELAREYQQQQSEPSAQATSGKQIVNPIITNASQLDQQVTINAYVGGIFENGGTCTATFTKDSLQIVKKNTAFANATTTDCPPVMMDRSEFSSKGDWQVSVAYDSAKATGISQPKTFTVK